MNKHYLVIAAFTALTGCTDAVVGEWESDDNTSSTQDNLSIDSDGTGLRTATDNGTAGGQNYSLMVEYEMKWELVNDNAYEFVLNCDDAEVKVEGQKMASGCTGVAAFFNITFSKLEADCSINDDGDVLKCDPEGSDDKIKYNRKD
ncbi:MAG: hypothetical protein VB934_13290 [Polyangiaceae bacterium]